MIKDLAIRNTHPSIVTINYTDTGEKFEALDSSGNVVTVDESAITTEEDRLQGEYDAQAYARNRKEEYPDWGTQLNKIYDDGVTKWKSEMVDPVKAKWPKDNSGPV